MWNKEHKILGILGGMGPLATQLFYRQIIERTEATCDQEHVDIILFNHASMPDRTTALVSGKGEELFARLMEDAQRLQRRDGLARRRLDRVGDSEQGDGAQVGGPQADGADRLLVLSLIHI